MEINERLIQDALCRATARDRDHVLTAVEAYRICVAASHRLRRSARRRSQRKQMLGCAKYCEKVLAEYALSGRLGRLQYPETVMESGMETVQFVLVIQ